MAQEIEVDININNNTEATIKNLRALKRQLRETAAGSAEFDRISMAIREMDDAIKDASETSDDFLGYLENASGPLGVLGKGIRGAEKNFSSFNAVLKASVIGIITAAIGGLVAAFSQSETAMKKLEPVFEAFNKILAGIMQVFDPLLDMFIELALRVLPYIAKGVGGFYSGLFALFSLVKNVGLGAGKILKGIFTLDFDALKEGYSQLTGSWNAAVEEFKEANKRFEASSTSVTKVEKKNATTRVAIRKTEKKEKDKVIDSELVAMREFQGEYEAYLKTIADLQNQYNKEIEDMQAVSEQQKLDLWYKRRAQEIDAITKDASVKNELYASLETQRAIKQAEIEKKKEDDLLKIRTDAEDSRSKYEDLQVEKQKQRDKLVLEAKKQLLNQTASLLGDFSNMLGQQTAEGKALAIAQATINAYLGISEVWKAPNPYPEPFGTATKIASTIAVGTAAFQNVKKILQVQVPGGGAGGSAPTMSATNAPAFNVVGTSGANANQIANLSQMQSPIKAYVVSQDVTTQQALDRNIVKSASLG
jgi:hypothetical protein